MANGFRQTMVDWMNENCPKLQNSIGFSTSQLDLLLDKYCDKPLDLYDHLLNLERVLDCREAVQ